jgi:hypothetical protein
MNEQAQSTDASDASAAFGEYRYTARSDYDPAPDLRMRCLDLAATLVGHTGNVSAVVDAARELYAFIEGPKPN